MPDARLNDRGLPPDYPFKPEWEVEPREVVRALRDGDDMLLIDCRTEQERAICSIKGALHVPLHELQHHLDDLRDREPTRIVVHCHHGVRSLQFAAILRAAGLERSYSMAGGIHLWARDVDRTMATY